MRYLSERPESPMPGPIDGVEPPPSAVMSEGTAAAALEVEKAGSTTGKKFTSQAALATPPPPQPPPPPPPPPPFEPPERAAAPAGPPIQSRARSKWGDSDEEPETTPEGAPEGAPEAAREGAVAPTLHHADVAARGGATPISVSRPFSPSTPAAEPSKSPPFAAPRVVKPLIEQARSLFEPKK
jgi:hypothetical protein